MSETRRPEFEDASTQAAADHICFNLIPSVVQAKEAYFRAVKLLLDALYVEPDEFAGNVMVEETPDGNEFDEKGNYLSEEFREWLLNTTDGPIDWVTWADNHHNEQQMREVQLVIRRLKDRGISNDEVEILLNAGNDWHIEDLLKEPADSLC